MERSRLEICPKPPFWRFSRISSFLWSTSARKFIPGRVACYHPCYIYYYSRHIHENNRCKYQPQLSGTKSITSANLLGLGPGSVRLRSQILALDFLVRSRRGRVPRPPSGLFPHEHSRGYAPPPSAATLNPTDLARDGETSTFFLGGIEVLRAPPGDGFVDGWFGAAKNILGNFIYWSYLLGKII